MTNTNLVTGVTFGLVFGAPWLLGTIYYLRRTPRDGSVPPSMGEQLRDRFLS